MASRLWTPADVPAAERANGGVWDFASAQLDSGGAKATAIPDLWGVRSLVQPVASLQVPFGRVGGFSALVFPDAVNSLKMATAAAFQPAWYAVVMQFRDGTQLNTDAAICTLWGNQNDTGSDRVRLRSQTGFLDAGIRPVVNDGPASDVILPLPVSMVEMAFAYGAGTWGPSMTPNANRSWRGPMFYAVALGAGYTLDTVQRFQGYLAHRFGFANRLPASHPFRTAPPMVYVQPVKASGACVLPGLIGSGQARAIASARGATVLPGLEAEGTARAIAKAQGAMLLPGLGADGVARAIAKATGAALLPALTGAGRLRSVFRPRGRISTATDSRITTSGNSGRII